MEFSEQQYLIKNQESIQGLRGMPNIGMRKIHITIHVPKLGISRLGSVVYLKTRQSTFWSQSLNPAYAFISSHILYNVALYSSELDLSAVFFNDRGMRLLFKSSINSAVNPSDKIS